jgi:hypothetical protein
MVTLLCQKTGGPGSSQSLSSNLEAIGSLRKILVASRRGGDTVQLYMDTTATCVFPGCINKKYYKGFRSNGKRRYKPFCAKHGNPYQRLRQRFRPTSVKRRRIVNDQCSRCGSAETCHRHRIDRSIGYRKDNVLVLCLSCHLQEHSGVYPQKPAKTPLPPEPVRAVS